MKNKQNLIIHKCSGFFRNKLCLFGISVAVCVVFIDVAVLSFGLDVASVKKKIYMVEAGAQYLEGRELYRDSKDSNLLYELIPNSKAQYQRRHPHDVDRSIIDFSINRLGFRSNSSAEPTAQKPDGVFRIIALGGSNTFGFAVSDSQTWPAQLERVLNEKLPGRFEVWNAGLNAYNMTQKVVYARRLIKEYEPDLLLFQQRNTGRRAFFYKARHQPFFRANKELWCENVPLIWFDSDPAAWFHCLLVRNWALYRLCVSEYNNYLVDSMMTEFVPTQTEPALFEDIFNRYFSPFADRLSSKLFFDFIFECQQTDSLGAAMIVTQIEEQDRFFVADLPLFFLETEVRKDSKPSYYYEIHPPSQVYEWYGEKIADWLIKEGLVPKDKN